MIERLSGRGGHGAGAAGVCVGKWPHGNLCGLLASAVATDCVQVREVTENTRTRTRADRWARHHDYVMMGIHV